ncbi:MAG: hypothetical protein ACYS9T_09820 [Planctomycetota bacterium]
MELGRVARVGTREYPRWIYYPNSHEPPRWAFDVVGAFRCKRDSLDSRKAHKTSNVALGVVRGELEKLGFEVEGGVTGRLERPVHFGEYGEPDRRYQIDSYHAELGIALEVEAGRTTRGNAIYRDVIQTSLLVGIRYFALAVPQVYRFKAAGKDITDSTYEACKSIFDAIYSSEQLRLPMEGILLIGY